MNRKTEMRKVLGSQTTDKSVHGQAIEVSVMSICSIIGSRCLPSSWESRVGEVVDLLLSRGHRICSGGTMGDSCSK